MIKVLCRLQTILLTRVALTCLTLCATVLLPAPELVGFQDSGQAETTETDDESAPPPLAAWETFSPDNKDDALDGTQDRAWEYRPYRVAVWFCLDGSPELNAVYPQFSQSVAVRSRLIDPSGWALETGRCPSRYRGLFLRQLDQPDEIPGFPDQRIIGDYDKVMVVCLTAESNHLLSRVREFDVQTQQWGPITERQTASASGLAGDVVDAIVASFMPIAIIDRVDEIQIEGQRPRDQVVMRARGVKSCVYATIEEVDAAALPADGEGNDESGPQLDPRFPLVVKQRESSPVYIRDSDRFLPIIRSTDRKGENVRLDPLEFTFLTVDSQEDAEVRASIQSSFRAPLSQRASRRAQKLALVIRPPESSTTLRLMSTGKNPVPLEGMEVFSRRPDQEKGTDNEELGLTDWRGEIEIPPSPDGLRLILVKRGSRPLKRIPIIPGLNKEVTTTLPNDETRLYAEGVFRGFQNEILSLITRREVAIQELDAALKTKNKDEADQALSRYQDLESLASVKDRLSNAASDLKFLTTDDRELGYIENNLKQLLGILTKKIEESRDTEFLERIQALSTNSN